MAEVFLVPTVRHILAAPTKIGVATSCMARRAMGSEQGWLIYGCFMGMSCEYFSKGKTHGCFFRGMGISWDYIYLIIFI